MNYNKKSLLYFCVFNVIVLSNIAPLQSMQSIEQDWGYKRREDKSLCCCEDTDDKEYPYFLSDKEIRPMISERDIATTYHDIFGVDCNMTTLHEEEKNTLAYVLEAIKKSEKSGIKEFRIEGRDKGFSQKMSLRVKNLPLEIRQTIATKYGETIMSNIRYQPSYVNTVMDNEDNHDYCARTVAGGISCLWYWLQKWCCSITPPIVVPPYNVHNDELENFRALTTMPCPACWYVIVRKCLHETPEQKDKRHGFAAIPLLKEMECKIVDAKEKVD